VTQTATPPVAPETPHRRSWYRRAWDVVDDRMGIGALRYPVPEHANNVAWSLGGVTAAMFLVLIVTGIILVQFYNPTPEGANASVRDIEQHIWLGSFIRGTHYWAAQVMYVTAALHLLRIFFTGSYKKHREGNWLLGVAMFGLVFLALFTGTVLKWDQEGYEALSHNIEIGRLLGGVGIWFSPDFAKNVPILVRLYGAHVVLIPVLIFGLLVWHALLVKRHRISPHPALPTDETGTQARADEPTEPFTHHLRRVTAFSLVALGGVGILTVALPPVVGPDPVAGIEVTLPPWPFWWMFTLENWIGLSGILWGGGALFLLLVAVPFVDRNARRHWRTRPVAMTLCAIVIVALIVLSILAVTTPAAQHLM
jgi:quinol---cytochrome c reductase cytochrome b subunit, bacillus type